MVMTLREYIEDGINTDEEGVKLAADSANWPHENGELLNWKSIKSPTLEQRMAVEADVELDLEATEKALEVAGEGFGSKKEKDAFEARFREVEVAYRLFDDDLDKTTKVQKKCQESESYKRIRVCRLVEQKLAGWRKSNELSRNIAARRKGGRDPR